ncbi:hypothetical protein B0H17DRAFT_1190194 [Mycena rosella]|uniref:Uncharacterized protein n=1 Tax=Mycena rosella TaxID=1033263 RepID=A0AAD7H2L8_MYCRO|nr:hypothetical protein B0H17DRAFT_1190194 [Mycena rosella]
MTGTWNQAREIGCAMAMSSDSFAALQLLVMPILMRRFDPLKMYLVYMGMWPLKFLFLLLVNVIARMGGDNPSSKIKAFLWLGYCTIQTKCSRNAYHDPVN